MRKGAKKNVKIALRITRITQHQIIEITQGIFDSIPTTNPA